MNPCPLQKPACEPLLPWWWRWGLIVVAALVLSGCQSPGRALWTRRDKPLWITHANREQSSDESATALATDEVGDSASKSPTIQQVGYRRLGASGQVVQSGVVPPLVVPSPALAWPPHRPVMPPTRDRAPFPDLETIRQGGDGRYHTTVQPDFSLDGLEVGDAVVHYDTLDGRVVVEPTNQVEIYAPRFGSVRAVLDLKQRVQVARTAAAARAQLLQSARRSQPVWTSTQDLQLQAARGTKHLEAFGSRQYPGRISQRLLPADFSGRLLPFEDLAVVQRGELLQADKPRLALGIQAAASWSHDKAVQVIIGDRQANAVVGQRKLQTIYHVHTPEGTARLRVIKLASKRYAHVGEEIHFTIRFDNVGTQVIGNVTIVDNLVSRLEYVEGSAQCSLKADFFTQRNEAGSLVLRWEIVDPLPPGQGGVIRFKCRVR